MPNKNTKEEIIKSILKLVKDRNESGELVIKKNITHNVGNDHRYNQGVLDVLEFMGFIKVERLGTSDIVKITDEGKKFLDKIS